LCFEVEKNKRGSEVFSPLNETCMTSAKGKGTSHNDVMTQFTPPKQHRPYQHPTKMSTPAPSPAPAAATSVEKKPTEKKPAEKKPAEDKSVATGPDGKQLTGKELKELKKAEKAARRQQSKGAEGAAPAKEGKGKPEQKRGQQQQKGGKKQGADGPVITLRLGAEAPTRKGGPATPQKEVETTVVKPQLSGLVALLRDIEVEQDEKKKRNSNDFGIEIAHSDVHPAILTLGMQINKRIIVGSSARCMGFLLAIKRVSSLKDKPMLNS
jgi:translation initiation factor eIF-2B subunit delta